MHCFEEAELVDLQLALVTQGKLTQNHTANAKVVNYFPFGKNLMLMK